MSSSSRTSQQASTSATGRRRKRPQPPVYNGVGDSYEDKDNDFVCPICFNTIEEAHMTKCGHTFCHRCIIKSLERKNLCPKCNFVIENLDQIFPNFALNELILKYKSKALQTEKIRDKKLKIEPQNGQSRTDLSVQDFLADGDDLSTVNLMLDYLMKKKQRLELDSKSAQCQILKEFLQGVRQKKQEALELLQRDLSVIDIDTQKVEEELTEHRRKYPYSGESPVMNGLDTPSPLHPGDTNNEAFNSIKNTGKQQWLQTTVASRRKKVYQHFDDLEECYFNVRLKELQNSTGEPSLSSTSSYRSQDSLEEFTECLSKFTRFTSFRPLASLNYASDIYNGSSIVSSIEFDRDCDYFAIAGVTKKIKIFEYNQVISDVVDVHYPVNEMVCNSKISCVMWSSYHKGMLASSDYEGTVTLWDAFAGVKTKVFQEHEKRCWSIDFNRMDPKLLASGSDDSKVKLWSTNTDHSVTSIEAKANVCCVKFNPASRYHVAFGSADHCVHYYDLRNTKEAIVTFKGHRKAVSYAKFVNSTEIVSASTDSQLKLWNVNKTNCLRTFRGHINEKNFVGLASDGDYVACGSENNSLYVYYKGLSKQLVTYKFDTVRSVLEKEKKEDDANEFVSAVTWKPDSNVIVAANSQGTIKVLELVG